MRRASEKRHPVWLDFNTLMRELHKKSGCTMREFTALYPRKAHLAEMLMSSSPSHGRKAWKRSDVDNLVTAIGNHLSPADVISIDYAFKAAQSMAESSDLLPEIDVSDFIDANGQINWQSVNELGPDHVRAFAVTEELLNRTWQATFMKRLRNLMHESKKRLSTFQVADRLFLALRAVSNGLMPVQERGSFEYMCWFHELIDGWIENEAQPTLQTVRSAISDTQYVNWSVLEFGRDLFLVDMELCRKLANVDQVPFTMQEQKFYVERSADNQLLCGRALYRAFTAERARTFNNRKIRLCVDLSQSALDGGSISLQPSNYYSAIATNEAANLILHSKVGRRTVRGDVFCMENGTMRELLDSRCSSQIGGNSLAFTSDGYLGLHIQTEDNFVGRGLSPSCSGSIDPEDAQTATHLGELIVNGTVRELREEALVRKDEQTTALTGYAICAHRGYKPDFFSVTKLKMTLADLRERHVERHASIEEFVGPHYYVEVGMSVIEAITSIEKLLDSRAITMPETNGKSTVEVPFGNVLTLALTLLHMHLTYRQDSVISQFLFDS